MRVTFVETSLFKQAREDYLPDELYAELQQMLMTDPDTGAVMPGCGGLRKLRIADESRGKGKRGGARVIYLNVPEAMRVFMIDIYGKEEQDDISAAERKLFVKIATSIKAEAVIRYKQWQKENES